MLYLGTFWLCQSLDYKISIKTISSFASNGDKQMETMYRSHQAKQSARHCVEEGQTPGLHRNTRTGLSGRGHRSHSAAQDVQSWSGPGAVSSHSVGNQVPTVNDPNGMFPLLACSLQT